MYSCAVCKKPVSVDPKTGQANRTCDHLSAGITADMKAHAYGNGGVKV